MTCECGSCHGTGFTRRMATATAKGAHVLRKKIAIFMDLKFAADRIRCGQDYLSDLECLAEARKSLHLAEAGKLPQIELVHKLTFLEEVEEKAEAVYGAALSAASSVLGSGILLNLESVELLLEAAHRLGLSDRWRCDAYEQCAAHEKRTHLSNKTQVSDTEDSVRHGIAWAEVLVAAAEEYLRRKEEKAGQGEVGQV